MSKSAECDLDKATKVARPFHFLIPFWGQRYREYFVNYCLPSLLAPNNLPLLEAKDGHVFLIATTADDWQAIEALPIMGRLRRHVLPKFLEIPHPKTETAPGSSNAIMYLNVCQRRLVEAAYRERCYGCLLWPDFILSDGMVASLLRDVSLGCHLVLAAAIRQVEENVVGELVSRGYLSGNIPCSISGDLISNSTADFGRSSSAAFAFRSDKIRGRSGWAAADIPLPILGDATRRAASPHVPPPPRADGFWRHR